MKVLVITAARVQKINDNVFNVLTAASQISPQCEVMVIGDADCSLLSQQAGVAKIIHLADIDRAQDLASHLARPLAQICRNYTHILTAADSHGKDLLPRIAGVLGLSQISDVLGIVSPNIFKKPMYAGNIIAEVESFEASKLLTIRPTCFAKSSVTAAAAPIEVLSGVAQINPAIALSSEEISTSSTIDLATAAIVVSGGRSLASPENFVQLIQGLAAKLGAAVGASRAAVEAGYAANDCQVGQTGKVVAPQIYIALGISGAVQHIAGMKDSKTVIAVNLDQNAQIFEYADYALVADLFEVVPELIANLN